MKEDEDADVVWSKPAASFFLSVVARMLSMSTLNVSPVEQRRDMVEDEVEEPMLWSWSW